jgi:O-methyltransferase
MRPGQLGFARVWRGLRNRMPGSPATRRTAWLQREYHDHNQKQRKHMFLSIARFCHINRPIAGYYFEFGCHSANTMRMAWDNFRWLFDFTYVAFDSFEGLPEIGDIDRQAIWEKGKLKTTESEFIEICRQHGMPRDRLIAVPGFYETSLNAELTARLAPAKAAVIYVDCDLYESTVPVLAFAKSFLQPGTVIVFDDWNCFVADPERGERRAFREFCERNPELRFEQFVSTDMQTSFVFVGATPTSTSDV